MEKMRRFDDPGITVIGFKPLSLLKSSHRMSPSKYIYPLENAITGSGTMYRALFKKCLERDLFILIRYTQKTNTTPQLAALVPLGKMEEEETTQSFHNYEGFHLIELPFAEDKRNLQDRLQAPKGEWYYKGLEAMALDLDVDLENEKAFDQIRPYYENPALEKRVAKQLQSFKNACHSEEPTSEPVKKRGKGCASGKADEELGKVTAKRGRKK
uniref:Ku domain-containing protein n=1 Tax=Ditylenchus dipsaci TaxID=166011 RepID=A0A915DLR0_9BILA